MFHTFLSRCKFSLASVSNQPMDLPQPPSTFTILHCIWLWSNIKPESIQLGANELFTNFSPFTLWHCQKDAHLAGENPGENHPCTQCFHRFSIGFPRRCRHDTADPRSISTLCTSQDGSSTVMEKSCTPPPGLAVPAAATQVIGEIARELGKRLVVWLWVMGSID